MIYGKLERLDRCRGMSRALDTAIDFLRTQDFSALPMGKTVIDGDSVFVNRFDYETLETSITEAHLRYIDIHVVLEGEEKIGVADLSTLRETERREDEDFIGCEGEFESVCTMRPGDFLITFPEDAHCPKLQFRGPSAVKKIVVKVLDA